MDPIITSLIGAGLGIGGSLLQGGQGREARQARDYNETNMARAAQVALSAIGGNEADRIRDVLTLLPPGLRERFILEQFNLTDRDEFGKKVYDWERMSVDDIVRTLQARGVIGSRDMGGYLGRLREALEGQQGRMGESLRMFDRDTAEIGGMLDRNTRALGGMARASTDELVRHYRDFGRDTEAALREEYNIQLGNAEQRSRALSARRGGPNSFDRMELAGERAALLRALNQSIAGVRDEAARLQGSALESGRARELQAMGSRLAGAENFRIGRAEGRQRLFENYGDNLDALRMAMADTELQARLGVASNMSGRQYNPPQTTTPLQRIGASLEGVGGTMFGLGLDAMMSGQMNRSGQKSAEQTFNENARKIQQGPVGQRLMFGF